MKRASVGAWLAVALVACGRPAVRPERHEHTQSSRIAIDAAVVVENEREPAYAPVAIEPAAVREVRRAPFVAPTRFSLANGLAVELQSTERTGLVHLRLYVRGVGSDSAAGRSLRESLRLAMALEEGGTRRNLAPSFGLSLAQAGGELRVDAGRLGLVLALDVPRESAVFALRKLGELLSEPSVAREGPSFSDWVARRTEPSRSITDRALVDVRRQALSALRGSDLPWSPREWTEVSERFAWPAGEDTTSRGLAREALRAGAMTLVVAGAITESSLRATLQAERWSAVPRGSGIALSPLAPLEREAPVRAMYTVEPQSAVSLALRWMPTSMPGQRALWMVFARALSECAPRAVAVSLYDDPARPVLALASRVEPSQSLATQIEALSSALDRALTDRCVEDALPRAVTALYDEHHPTDPARWADARVWALHDQRSDELERALLDALSAATIGDVRSVVASHLAGAPRAWAASGAAEGDRALCAVRGVRSVRVGRDERACP